MIRARQEAGAVVVESSLADDAIAYIDADWIPPSGSGDVPSLVVSPDGTISLGDSWETRASAGVAPQAAAASVLDSIARDAVAVAERHAPPGSIRVVGSGVIAARAREILSSRDGTAGRQPAAIIDTTGDPSVMAKATEELADLGVLVLAGMPPPSALALNMYPDVHVRGLWIVGSGPLASKAPEETRGDAREEPSPLFADALQELDDGSTLVTRSGWYTVSGTDARR